MVWVTNFQIVRMRIITKFTLLYLILLFITLIAGGLLTYQIVKQEVKNETDYSLLEYTRIIVGSIEEGKPIHALENAKVQIEKLDSNGIEDKTGVFSDTLMMHRLLNRMEVFRSHTSIHRINDDLYSINVNDVFIEENDMLEVVFNTMLRLFIVLSLLFIIFGFIFSRIILKPFQETLDLVDNFEIDQNQATKFPKSSTKEFSQLNLFLNKMMKRVSKDYNALKEFSENASHEMQTPLAIAKGKLEILQESKRLREAEHDLIITSQRELSKLSNLTQSLGLLTKLDNEEFRSNEIINFSKILNESLVVFKELAALKNVTIHSEVMDEVMMTMNPSLVDVLLGNLLKNAVHHNIDNGSVDVNLSHNLLIIKNQGPEPQSDVRTFFKRFSKNNPSSESLGLGLSIVKKICDLNDVKIDYSFQDGWHIMTLNWD